MGAKIAKGILTSICVILLLICAGMIIFSAMFGSEQVVDVFGKNIYISETDEFELVPQGSAVIVEKCPAYEVEPGNLVLYTTTGDVVMPCLGYTESVSLSDGVYTLIVSDNAGEHIVSEGSLVGVAAWSSEFLGGFITFMLSPLGICLIAVLPCIALILFEIIKSAASKLPPPEVIPQVKNTPEEEQPSKISVKSDGSAQYQPRGEQKPASVADSVLFKYKTSTSVLPQVRRTNDVPVHLTDTTAKPRQAETSAPKHEATGSVPMSVAAKRYVDSTLNAPASDTAELPVTAPKKQSNAFFAQSSAPQIGGRKPVESGTKNVIELEDALATARKGGAHTTASTDSKDWRKNVSSSALISDDDDSADRSRYEVDNILAGLDKKRK